MLDGAQSVFINYVWPEPVNTHRHWWEKHQMEDFSEGLPVLMLAIWGTDPAMTQWRLPVRPRFGHAVLPVC